MIDLKRFREENNIKQSDLCNILNTKQPYVSAMESGKRPVSEDKFKILLDYFGEGILKYKQNDNIIIVNNPKKQDGSDDPQISYDKGVPFFNVDFIGGFDHVLNNQTINPEYLINFREYNDATCWCNVTGHSMEPEITHGDIIALKELHDWKTYIPSGEIYGIVTTEHRTIKKVCPSPKDGFITLIPSNKSPEFVTQDIPISIILRVYKVLGCMKRL